MSVTLAGDSLGQHPAFLKCYDTIKNFSSAYELLKHMTGDEPLKIVIFQTNSVSLAPAVICLQLKHYTHHVFLFSPLYFVTIHLIPLSFTFSWCHISHKERHYR